MVYSKSIVFFCEENTLSDGIKIFFTNEFPFVDIKCPTTPSNAEAILQYHGPNVRLVIVSANQASLTLFTNVQNSLLTAPFFFLNRGHASEIKAITQAKRVGAFDILTAPLHTTKLRSSLFSFLI